jgi:phytoene dehydrogenase-like protein
LESWDGIVIGAGHNGLTCAAYLARAGLKVLVLEANPWIGGGTVTEGLTLPGFKHNTHANYFIGFDVSPVYLDLELDRWGFRFVVPDVQCAWLFRDGRALVIHRDLEPTAASIARFSRRDAETYRSLYERIAVAMRPLFVSLLYNPPLTPAELRERLQGPWADELLSHAPLTPYEAVERHFESEAVRVFFKTLLHVITADNVPGTGLLFISLLASFTRQALPVGGSAAFPRALANVVEAHGGRVVTGARVEHVVVRGRVAREVELADGRRFEAASFLASAVDFPQTVAMAEGAFDGEIDQKARGWKWNAHTFTTLHLALAEPPRYGAAAFDPDVEHAYNVFFGVDDSQELVEGFEQIGRGQLPDRPVGNGACNTLFDPGYAPAGRHAAFWWPFAPYALDDDPECWETRREEVADRLLESWSAYAPNLRRQVVLARRLFTPRDIERHNLSMPRGSVRGGAYHPDQLGINRPHPALSGYRTPIAGLYLCGSSAASGGGVNSAPGYNAAGVIADDLGLERWWPTVPEPAWEGTSENRP